MLTRRGRDLLGFAILNATIALGAYLALGEIRSSQKPVPLENDPTPLGYTRSLVLFVLPCLVFGGWLLIRDRDRDRRRAFLITVGALAPIGILLDLILGKEFFVFPNTAAVLGSRYPGMRFPAYDWNHGWRGLTGAGWVPGYLPIEEFLFYGLGFACILLTYIWCEAVLFGDEKSDLAQPVPAMFRRAWSSIGLCLLVAALLFLAGYALHRSLRREEGGFPGYFLFLLLCALLPSLVCFRVAFHFVHWRALTVAWLFVLSISQFWEASLGLPYQWWDYRHATMIGLFVRPHCDLPVEAVVVWSLASWTTAIVHETVLAALRLRRRTGVGVFRILWGSQDDIAEVKARESTDRFPSHPPRQP